MRTRMSGGVRGGAGNDPTYSILRVLLIMGHTTLEMVRRYAQQVTSDLQAKHRQFSPVDRL